MEEKKEFYTDEELQEDLSKIKEDILLLKKYAELIEKTNNLGK